MSPESATPSPKAKRPEVPRERWKCKTRGSHGAVQLPQKFLIKSVRAAIIQLLYFAPKAISRHRACNGRNVQYKACESCELHFRGMLVSLHTRFILSSFVLLAPSCWERIYPTARQILYLSTHSNTFSPQLKKEPFKECIFVRNCHIIIMLYNQHKVFKTKKDDRKYFWE